MLYVKTFDMLNENFTFKTERPTGKWKSFDSDRYVIKMNKKEVGSIDDDKPHKIRLMVMKTDKITDGNPNCPWKWITLKKESETMEEAKEFLKSNYDSINSKFTLYHSE